MMACAWLGCGIWTGRGYLTNTYTTDDGTTITRMSSKEIGVARQAQRTSGKYRGNSICYLDAQRCRQPDGTVTYDLLVTIRWSDPGFVHAYREKSTQESLSLVIDGETVELWPRGDARREEDQLSHYITDSWIYPATADILRDLAAAREVFVTVSGEGGTLEGYFENANKGAFKRFWEECGDTAGP